MSVTVINEWRFLAEADLDDGMAAIHEYMTYLRDERTGLQQSLWLRATDDPLRFYHIATYTTREDLDRERTSDGTARFVERLYPLIDETSVAQPTGVVTANTGSGPGEIWT